MRLRAVAVAVLVNTFAVAAHAYTTSVWIPPWLSGALTSIQQNGASIDESNPVWYSWNADGTIAKNWNAENPTWRAAMTGSRLVPTVQNLSNKAFNGTLAATILGDPGRRETHADSIAQLAIANAFDGIDIDYEKVPASSRADFTAFVQTLAAKLHAAGKTLSVTVYAKTAETTRNGPGSQDWLAIGRSADTVKIMAYDYHWSTSGAGAVTPLEWLDSVASYAQANIPSAKIIMGLPWYGYDWVGTTGTSVSYEVASTIARNNGATVARDASGEATFSYADHTVFFQDAAAYRQKVELLKRKHAAIGGFAHWAAGQEDPEVWDVIRGTSPSPVTPGGSSPATPAASDFAISGPSLLAVQTGSAQSFAYSLTPINGFGGQVNVGVSSLGVSALDLGSSATANASSPATVTVKVPRGTAAGVYQIVVRFSSGSVIREKTVNITVTTAAAGRRRAA